jgi:hypothetical protein
MKDFEIGFVRALLCLALMKPAPLCFWSYLCGDPAHLSDSDHFSTISIHIPKSELVNHSASVRWWTFIVSLRIDIISCGHFAWYCLQDTVELELNVRSQAQEGLVEVSTVSPGFDFRCYHSFSNRDKSTYDPLALPLSPIIKQLELVFR